MSVMVTELQIRKYLEKRKTRMAIARRRGTHTEQEWEQLKAAWDYRCLKCWEREPVVRLGKDHVIAVMHPWCSDAITNIQPMCFPCNCSRGVSGDYRYVRQHPEIWTPVASQMPIPSTWKLRGEIIWFILRNGAIMHGRFWRSHWKLNKGTVTNGSVVGWATEKQFLAHW